METNNLDIFSVNLEDFNAPSAQSSNSKDFLFKPDPNQAKDKVYSAVIRPVYWLGNPSGFNPKSNFIEKKTFYLKNDADQGGYFDSASSIGEKCPAMDAFFNLKRQGKTDQRSEDLANDIRPKSSYFYLIYVEKDLINPDNDGKLMVWKAPIQVHKLINSKINLDEKAIKLGKKAEDVFSPLVGRNLEVNVGLKGGFWNYDGCEWQESRPLKFKGEKFTAESKKEFVDFITLGNEMMNSYVYTPMEADRKELLLDIITEKTGITFGKTSIPKKEQTIKGFDESNSIGDILKDEPKKKESKPVNIVKDIVAEDHSDINGFLDDLDLDI